mgnify:CR=1 FL=1
MVYKIVINVIQHVKTVMEQQKQTALHVSLDYIWKVVNVNHVIPHV